MDISFARYITVIPEKTKGLRDGRCLHETALSPEFHVGMV